MPNADGSVIIKTRVDVNQAEKDLGKLKKEIAKTESEIESMGAKRAPLVQQLEKLGVLADDAARKLDEMKNAASGTYTSDQIKTQTETAKQLGAQFDSVEREASSYTRKIENATKKLNEQKTEAGELEKRIRKVSRASLRMEEARTKAEKNMARFGSRMKSVIRSALVFTLITKALAEVRKWVAGLISTNDEARASVARLKGALLTMAQPLINVVIPTFTRVVDILTNAFIVIGRLFAAISGESYENAKDAADALNKEQEAIKGVGAAAKKAEGQLASFDEINKLASTTESNYIAPDFDGLSFSRLPEWLQSLTLELEAKIERLKFKYDRSSIVQESDDFDGVFAGLLGLVIGGAFGGLKGAVIGLALGCAASLTGITFEDLVLGAESAKTSFLEVMRGILLAVVGGSFGGFTGAIIGLALSVAIDVVGVEFFDRFENPESAKTLFEAVLVSILGAVLGAKFGGLTGAAIGLLLGALVSFVGIEFKKGEGGNWDKDKTLITVMAGILGGILGATFGGFSGAIIGMLLGATISFAAISFSDDESWNKQDAISSLRTAIATVLGAVLGVVAFKFLGVSGGIIGSLFGLTIGFASVAFDPEMDPVLAKKAKSNFLTSMTALFGAIIGTALLGPVGTIAGGAIGLTVGLFINFVIEGWDFVKENVPGFTGIGPDYSWMFKDTTVSTSSIASGFVVPKTAAYTPSYISNPDEFFGSGASGSRNASNGGTYTFVVNLDGKEVARNQYGHLQDIERAVGK
jgi:hypothetical protein